MSRLIQVNPPQILLVQNDPELTPRLCTDLRGQGYDLSIVSEPQAAIAHVQAQSPALVIIDQQVSEQSGLRLCHQLRANGARMPLILLMTADLLVDRIACLEAGADDYVPSPYHSEVLLQRVRMYLNVGRSTPEKVLSFQDLRLDLTTRKAQRGSREMDLTMKEFELLRYLMEHPREILTREQILDNVWGFDFRGESNVIEVYIRYLRLKVQLETEKRLIHTVRGVGYVLREA